MAQPDSRSRPASSVAFDASCPWRSNDVAALGVGFLVSFLFIDHIWAFVMRRLAAARRRPEHRRLKRVS